MKIAYLIRAHRAPAQVARLVGALRREGAQFFVHIDAKVDEGPFRAALAAPDVRFIARRTRMNWGGYSMVRATLQCLRELLAAYDEGAPDRVVNMSGQDYPLISNAAIAEYFARHADIEFISYGAMPPAFWGPVQMQRIERYQFYDCEALVWPSNTNGALSRRLPWRLRMAHKLAHWLLPRRSLPAGVTPYGGSAWWCLTGATARRLLALADENPALARFYRYTLHPEEMYFQTLLMNSGMDPARVRGEYLEKALGDYLWFVDWRGASPRILRADDLDLLLRANRMFARKFDAGLDSRVLDLIDAARLSHTLR